ncbi:MAG: replicative DNA helicase [Gaiellaceae bacterium]
MSLSGEMDNLAALPKPTTELLYDEDAEISVVGAVLRSETAVAAVLEHVTAGDFYRHDLATIFRTAVALWGAGHPVDPVAVHAKLEETGQAAAAGGKARIHEVAQIVTATANAAHHAKTVRELSILRSLLGAGQDIVQLAKERGEPTRDLVAKAEQVLFEVSQRDDGGELVPLRSSLVETFERVQTLYELGATVTGLSSGFPDLDQVTAGFQPGNLIILAARPSMGKSALGLCIAANAAVQANAPVPTAFFSLEMSLQEIAQRMMCLDSKVDSHKIRTGQLSADDWPRLSAACARLENAPFYIDDTPGLSLLELRSRAQTLKRREPQLGLVVVDYLQLMTAGGSVESRLQEVSAVSRGLKALAKDLDVPVLALSQLSRAVEQRTDKRPVLSDLRESGSIEQDADVVMFIYRDEYYAGEESEHQGIAELHIAKHRNGPTDTIQLAFMKRFAKFASHRAA